MPLNTCRVDESLVVVGGNQAQFLKWRSVYTKSVQVGLNRLTENVQGFNKVAEPDQTGVRLRMGWAVFPCELSNCLWRFFKISGIVGQLTLWGEEPCCCFEVISKDGCLGFHRSKYQLLQWGRGAIRWLH